MTGRVAVTGANGFVGTAVVAAYVDAGYTVHATVRSEEKGKAWLALQPPVVQAVTKLFVVKDITVPGAFDEAIKGVDILAHTASPAAFAVKTIDELVQPAVDGTLGALKSAAGELSCKRVVITSSVVACVDAVNPINGQVYTGDDWPSLTYEQAKVLPPETGAWYYTSKKLAEKAAWDFMENEKPHFALATILPVLIYGPTTHLNKSSEFNFSLAVLWRLINGDTRDALPATIGWALADVRDVAKAHVLASTVDGAEGKRYLVSSYYASNAEVAAIARKAVSEDKAALIAPAPAEEEVKPTWRVDCSPIEELGLKFLPFEQCISDTVKSLWEIHDAEKA